MGVDEKFFREIREHLETVAQNSGERRFVTKQNQKIVWKTGDRLLRLAGFLKLELIPLQRLENNLLQTLSILVSMSWTDWPRFIEIFIDGRDNDGEHVERTDEDIPGYTYEMLLHKKFFGEKAPARRFMEERFVFMPIVIEKGKSMKFDEGHRMPFIEGKSKEIGEGSYGKVTQETIEAYQLNYHNGNPNTDRVKVARKHFVVEKSFLDETRVLETLRSSLSRNKRIATFIATISIGNEFNILSELASMSLQELLETNPSGFHFTVRNMVTEVKFLAYALRHLHYDIMVPTGTGQEEGQMTCCHLDLKPENILVYPGDKQSPVGKWKITDFGISSVKEAVLHWKNQQSNKTQAHNTNSLSVPSFAALKVHLTNKTSGVSVMQRTGTWQAPEVHSATGTISGQKGDVWSYGCIFAQVLARALGGLPELEQFNEQRGKTDPATSDADDTFYRKVGDDYKLNPYVEEWIKSLDQREESPEVPRLFFQNCRKLISYMLQIRPEDRLNTKEIVAALGNIYTSPIDDILGPRIHQDPRQDPPNRSNENPKFVSSSNLRLAAPNMDQPFSVAHGLSVLSQNTSKRGVPEGKGKGILEQTVEPSSHTDSISLVKQEQDQDHVGVAVPNKMLETDYSIIVESPVDETIMEGLLLHGRSDTVRRQTIQSSHYPPPQMIFTPPDALESGLHGHSTGMKPSSHSRNRTVDDCQISRLSSFGSSAPQKLSLRTSSLSPHPTSISRPNNQAGSSRLNPIGENFSQARSSLSSSSISDDGMSTRPVSIYSEPGPEVEVKKVVITFPLTKNLEKTIIQTVISTKCNKIAFIGPTEIQVFLMKNQLSGCMIRPDEGGGIFLGACLTEKYLLTRAKHQSCYIFSIYSIRDTREGGLVATSKQDFDHDTKRLNGVLSEDRFILFQYAKHVTLKDLKLDAPHFRLDVAGRTRKIWFSASGSLAFVWSAQGRDHFIDALDVHDTSTHFHYKYRVPDSDNYERPIEDVLSFPSKPSCLIWKYRGHICIRPLAQTPQTAQDVAAQAPMENNNTWSLKPLQAITVGWSEDIIVYVRSRSNLLGSSSAIYKCQIYLKGDEERLSIRDAPKGIELELPLQETSMQEQHTFSIGVKSAGEGVLGSFQVFIAHFSGKVEVINL